VQSGGEGSAQQVVPVLVLLVGLVIAEPDPRNHKAGFR
jgi:hypothetical protein